MRRVKKALISVWDKTDLLPFVQGLRQLGISIISTGGTSRYLKEHGIPVKEVAEFAGYPEILAGRVKTLHPKVHGGILARREDREHLTQVRRLGLELIDLVVVNLYPFEEMARRANRPMAELVEQIDIGGVALIRSAAKNFSSVGIVSSPAQYDPVLKEIKRSRGTLSESTRFRLGVAAFAESAYYDGMIHQVLAHRLGRRRRAADRPLARRASDWPRHLVLGATRRQILRYGENPHQMGIWYQWPPSTDWAGGMGSSRQLHGKELSFNNLLDLDAALQVVSQFKKPCAVVIKHANPSGAACAARLHRAFEAAFACDPVSSFGGVVGVNRSVDRITALAIAKAGFLECLIAPGYAKEALTILRAKKNLRVVQVPAAEFTRFKRCVEFKQIGGGLLAQEPDTFQVLPSRWRLATNAHPTSAQRQDLEFAWKVARFVRSNAIVIAKGLKTVGIGAGQASRVDSVRVAIEKAGTRAKGAVLASDGFFPKPDGPALAVKAGVKAIVQPGGSIQDPQVIQVAKEAKIPMLLTGERHFKH